LNEYSVFWGGFLPMGLWLCNKVTQMIRTIVAIVNVIIVVVVVLVVAWLKLYIFEHMSYDGGVLLGIRGLGKGGFEVGLFAGYRVVQHMRNCRHRNQTLTNTHACAFLYGTPPHTPTHAFFLLFFAALN